jgi:hypothetical protein
MKSDRPTFLYSMTPSDRTSYQRFFELGPIKTVLENPGQLRPSGWDLITRDRARIIDGKYVEVKSAERKRIRVYEDGSLFVRVAADEDFLGWGQNNKNFQAAPRLNTLALIEFTLNFCKLCSPLVAYMAPEPKGLNLKIQIRNAIFGTARLFLIPYPVSNYAFTMAVQHYFAPDSQGTLKLPVASEQMKSRPGVVAYQLVRQIFYWFEVNEMDLKNIPYSTTGQDGLSFIDEDLIINSRGS